MTLPNDHAAMTGPYGGPHGPGPRSARLQARLSHAVSRVAARCAAAAAALALAGCQPGVLDPAGPVGQAQKQILLNSLAIMLAIIVPTILATLAFAWWYRASNEKAVRKPDFVYSGRLEMVTWGVPLLTIMLLGGVAWVGSHDLEPSKPLESSVPAIEVQVVSLDWKWLFIYPEQKVASVNQLVIPAGTPIRFALTSSSVMNSFFVPQLGSMIYTMNGMATQLNLQADQPGTFHGLSTHYSGDGFSDMSFEVKSMPAEQFTAWVEAARGTGAALDPASYAKLAEQSSKVGWFTYRDVEPDIFNKIVTQELPPGPGPAPASIPKPLEGQHQAGQPAPNPSPNPGAPAPNAATGAPARASVSASHRMEH